MNEKDCFDDFIVGFDFGVGRVPLGVSWWRPLREGKMRELLVSRCRTRVRMSQPSATIRHSGKSGSSTQRNRVFALDRNGQGAEEFAFSANITKKGDRG